MVHTKGEIKCYRIKDVIKSVCWDLFLAIIIVYAYNILFRLIEGLEYTESRAILWGVLILFIAVRNILYRNASVLTKFIFYAIPFGIYSGIAFFRVFEKYISIIIVGIILLSIVYIAAICFCIANSKANIKRYFKKQIKKCILGFFLITSIGSVLLMAPLMAKNLFNLPLSTSSVKEINGAENDGYTLSNNIGTVSKLFDGTWKEVSVKEKLNILQVVLNIENNYLGLPHELKLCSEILDEHITGDYDAEKYRININREYLEEGSPESLLGIVCHESYHAYQNELIYLYDCTDKKQREMLCFYNVSKYKKEMSAYIKGEDNFEEYSKQAMEVDARRYAESAVKEYKTRVYEYMNN